MRNYFGGKNMIFTKQSSIKKLMCILLAVCMIIGLMPVMSLPARADDNYNPIGTLEDGTPRYGSGWMWDGDLNGTGGTLTLFGADINAGSDKVFTYDGDISIELVGYNKVSSTAVFAGIQGNCAYISGSGVLEIDCPFGSKVEISSGYIKSSAKELSGNHILTMNGGCISAPNAASYDVKMYKGYLDVKAISQNTDVFGGYLKAKEALNSSFLRIQNSVVEITGQMAGFVDTLKENSVFIYNDTMWSGFFNESGNDYNYDINRHLVGSTIVWCTEYIDVADTVINKQKRGVYSEKPVKIEEGGSFFGGNYFKISDDDHAVSASSTGDTPVTDAKSTIVTNGGKGIYLDNAKLGDGTTAVNVNGSGTGITLENSSTGNGSTLVAADSSVCLSGGSTVGDGSDVISNCSAQADFGDFTLSENSYMTICNSSKDTFNINVGKINGSLTYASENGGININISDDNSKGTTIGLNSIIAAYVSDGKILQNEWYVPTHTFYYADDIGTEFRTTTDTAFKQHMDTAKAVYYGRELQPRLDADVYTDDNGASVESTTNMSAGGNDTAQFVISSSCKITSPDTDVTASLITPYGQTSQNAGFTMNSVGGNDKRIMVKMQLKGAVVPGDYKVCVKFGDRTCDFPITLTNTLDTPLMDFTADAWTYRDNNGDLQNFTGTDTNVTDGTGWAWYGAPEESDGYDKYTLVLNNFDGMGDHPIKLPAGSTIILKGLSTIATLGSSIVCSGSLTITRDDLETGYLICRAGQKNDEATAAIDVSGGNLTIKGVTVDLSVEGTDSDARVVHAEFSFIIHDAIVTLSNKANSTFCDAVASTEMYLGGTSTLTAQAPGNVFGGVRFVSAMAESVENVSGLTLDQYNDSCKNNDGTIITGNYLTCDNKTMPLVIKTKGVTVDKNKVNLPAFTGNNSWALLTDHLNVSNGSGNYRLIDKDNVLAGLSGKDGISSIKIDNNVLKATFDETFEGCTFTLYVDERWPELRGDGKPVRVTIDRYYTITATSTGSGSVVLAENNSYTVIRGGSVAYVLTPADGNKISSVTYNGMDFIGPVDKYGDTITIENITSDGTLDVEFAPLGYFTLDVIDNGHCTYTVDPSPTNGKYFEDTEITVAVTPETNWKVAVALLDGEPTQVSDGKVVFKIAKNRLLDIQTVYLLNTVTVDKIGGGSVISSAAAVADGGSAEFTITPAEGWRIKSAALNGADVKSQIGEDGKFTVDNVTEDITLSVEFEMIPEYTLTIPEIPHASYTVSPAASAYRDGTEVTVAVSAEDNWVVSSVMLNGNELPLTEDNKYTFIMNADSTLTVNTECLLRTVTVVCGTGGKVSPENAEVLRGTQAAFSITPDPSYRIASVKLDGAALTVSDGACTFTVNEDCTLTVEFAKIGGNSGNGGSVRPTRPSGTTSQKLPSINGTEKSWADIAAELNKLSGGSVVISLNGETTVPADVIRAIANKRIKAEFVIDSVKSWVIDGSKITAVSSADLSTLPGNADKSALRGVTGADLSVNGTGVPAGLKLSFRREFAGQFANVYKLADKKLVFQGCVKLNDDGSAVIPGTYTAGEYVVMVCEFSDLPGDVNNDGTLNALDASAILKDIVGDFRCANSQMGDFNGDGVLNALDASAILRQIVL